MTRESAKANLEFITAYANGEEIQFCEFTNEWIDIDEPMFIDLRKYRVKPKPVSALHHPKHNQFKINLERFTEFEIDCLLKEGWVKVKLVQCNE